MSAFTPDNSRSWVAEADAGNDVNGNTRSVDLAVIGWVLTDDDYGQIEPVVYGHRCTAENESRWQTEEARQSRSSRPLDRFALRPVTPDEWLAVANQDERRDHAGRLHRPAAS